MAGSTWRGNVWILRSEICWQSSVGGNGNHTRNFFVPAGAVIATRKSTWYVAAKLFRARSGESGDSFADVGSAARPVVIKHSERHKADAELRCCDIQISIEGIHGRYGHLTNQCLFPYPVRTNIVLRRLGHGHMLENSMTITFATNPPACDRPETITRIQL